MMSTTRALRIACMLLLLAQVACDWVEIEQNHYKPERKPMVSSNSRESYKESLEFEETLNYGAANNKRNEDKKWIKGVVDRVTNAGNIRRVQTPSVKTTGIKLDHAGTLFRKNVSYMGEADRLKFRDNTNANTANRHFFTERSNVVSLRPNQDSTGIKSIEESLNRLKSDFDKHEEQESSVNKLNKNNIYQMQRFHKQPLKNEDRKVFVQKESIKNDFDDNFQIIKFGHTRTSPRPNVFYTSAPTTKKIKIFHRKRTTEEPITQDHDDIKYTNFTITKPSAHSRMKISITTEKTTNFKIFNTNRPKTLETKILPLEKNEDDELPTEEQSRPTENATNDKNEKKMDGMLKLMKVVSDIIYKNTHRSFKGKVVYLEGLKSTLLTTIEDHIDKLWPNDSDRSRQVREARGHLEFPSSESALMTISFLTFAVFLIKLVLQVIHTYKNKTMMVTPTVVAAVGRVAREMRSTQ